MGEDQIVTKREKQTMRTVYRRWLSAAALCTAAGLSACSGESSGPAEAPQQAAAAAPRPDYYPADYDKIVEASKQETGLLIYSNVAEYNWREILAGFKQHYPWIKVATLDLGPGEMFERYYSETSAKQKTADLIVNAAPDVWQRFVASGSVEPYPSAEDAKLPAWSKPSPGLYTASTDPLLIIYNKMLLKPAEYPASMTQLADLMTAEPDRFRNKVTTYDATSHSFAYAIHWTVVDQKKPSGWELMEKIGPLTRPESGGATMLDKVTSGEYLAAYYTSGATTFSQLEGGRDRVVGWAFPSDGTPIMLRGMAVTRGGGNPNSAKLMLDFIASHEGQVAMGKGGMTPYRPDVTDDQVRYQTYHGIEQKVGADNIVLIGYEPRMVSEYKPFIERWSSLFKTRH